jgi:hypothetical protein
VLWWAWHFANDTSFCFVACFSFYRDELVIADSPLVGALRTELGLLTNLATLEIKRVSNTMEGTLPTELGRLGDSLVKMFFRLSN